MTETMRAQMLGDVSDRRACLFAAACCRAYSRACYGDRPDPDEPVIDAVERYADGAADVEEARARGFAAPLYGPYGPHFRNFATALPNPAGGVWVRARRCVTYTEPEALDHLRGNRPGAGAESPSFVQLIERIQIDFFGGPPPPVAFSPDWRTDTAVTLARQMYESRHFSAMPILADALQDAGCDSAEVLDHCRGPGPHVRGCWVCDLVLGKE